MCEPTTIAIAGMAASAAGTYMQTNEAAKNQARSTNAKNQAFAEGMTRQRQYADEAGASFSDEITNQGADNFEDKRVEDAAERLQAFNDVRVQDDYTAGAASTPKNVVLAQQRAKDAGRATTDRDAENLTTLSGYDGALFGQGLARNEYARAFGNLSDKALADSNLIGLDMQSAAANSQKAGSIFPTLLKTAGSAASMYGAGGGSFGSATPGANSITQVGGQSVPIPLNKPSQAFGGFF